MKKIAFIIISLLVICTFTACSSQNTDSSTDVSSVEKSDDGVSESEKASAENADAASGGKTLIVYFSATGNTKEAAQCIATATDGDLFELEPVEPYTAEDLNWRDETSRVTYEHDNPSKRNVALVAAGVDNFDDYDTVFIGYPIWWGIAAWPVNSFVEANDFTGKTVIPFCTSSSSGLGESGELLRETAGTGNWLDGIRFSSGVSEKEVTEWVKSLGY